METKDIVCECGHGVNMHDGDGCQCMCPKSRSMVIDDAELDEKRTQEEARF